MDILRFVDQTEWCILIDEIDTSTIDVILFSGTFRDNLDPFGEHDDAECMETLYRVQMISQSQFPSRRTSQLSTSAASRPASVHEDTTDSVSATFTDVDATTTVSLDTKVSPRGTNFSQAQKQLIAMARASVDFATDAKIQKMIREEFTQSLLLMIAHRLRTVIEIYDHLIIAEFDMRLRLIQQEDGIFWNMYMKSGSVSECK
ncbi:uncharacterized protein EV420DRAFT_1582200, partial [Desarmillaria tabescens]